VPAAIVTGSDSGIGKATAVHLARAGYDVGITWHQDEEGALDTARQVELQERRAEVRRLDLADLPAAADVIDELAEALGGLDVLVNNAGTGRSGPFLELSWADWTHTLDVDLNGAFLYALGGLTKQMALELGRHGITVNSVAPGEIATPMTGNEDVDPRTLQRRAIPVGRPGDANEVAALIVYLCGDAAAYNTGASYVIDGGMLLVAAERNRD
jgi:NAD(P)-dependent dehydrogenase (short-subunit alcohol dehydrogenase family)